MSDNLKNWLEGDGYDLNIETLFDVSNEETMARTIDELLVDLDNGGLALNPNFLGLLKSASRRHVSSGWSKEDFDSIIYYIECLDKKDTSTDGYLASNNDLLELPGGLSLKNRLVTNPFLRVCLELQYDLLFLSFSDFLYKYCHLGDEKDEVFLNTNLSAFLKACKENDLEGITRYSASIEDFSRNYMASLSATS